MPRYSRCLTKKDMYVFNLDHLLSKGREFFFYFDFLRVLVTLR